MIKLKYSQCYFMWVLDSAALTEQERNDISRVRAAMGSYGAGTATAQAADRLAEAGLEVHFVLDGGPRLFFNGTAV